ncbi:MAG: hypothetical protein ACHQ1D_13455, partial [Nitrososphaerales archaeon]
MKPIYQEPPYQECYYGPLNQMFNPGDNNNNHSLNPNATSYTVRKVGQCENKINPIVIQDQNGKRLLKQDLLESKGEQKTVLNRNIPFPASSDISIFIEGRDSALRGIIDSGSGISIVSQKILDTISYEDIEGNDSSNLLTLVSVFNEKARSKLIYINCKLNIQNQEREGGQTEGHSYVKLLVAISDLINDEMILSLNDYVDMLEHHRVVVPSVEVISDKKLCIRNIQLVNSIDCVDVDFINTSDDVCTRNVECINNTSDVLYTNNEDEIQGDQKCENLETLNSRFAEAFVLKAHSQAISKELTQTDMLTSAEFKVMQKSDKNLETYFKLVGNPESKFYLCPSTGLLFRKTIIGGKLISQLVVPEPLWEK